MSKMKMKTQLFDLTLNSGRTDFATLVNTQGVVVENIDSYFGTAKSEDGVDVILQRTVDYWEEAQDPEARPAIYTPPIC